MIQPEPLYTIQELTMLHGLSRMTIARLYENEPGVLILSRKIRNKRGHRTMRVPRHVHLRVMRKLMVS
jgi:hypothetical protein